jgi:hypothetical protein
MNLNGRKIKAPYQTIPLGEQEVEFVKASKNVKTGEFKTEKIKEKHPCWLVKFPMGHSVRFVGERGRKDLERLGYHKKPRLIDMETGDVVDIGGDPYDMDGGADDNSTIVLSDE